MTLVQPVAGKEPYWTGVRMVGWDFQIYLLIFIISSNFFFFNFPKYLGLTVETSPNL